MCTLTELLKMLTEADFENDGLAVLHGVWRMHMNFLARSGMNVVHLKALEIGVSGWVC